MSNVIVLKHTYGNNLSIHKFKSVLKAQAKHFCPVALSSDGIIYNYPAESKAPVIAMDVADNEMPYYSVLIIYCDPGIKVV